MDLLKEIHSPQTECAPSQCPRIWDRLGKWERPWEKHTAKTEPRLSQKVRAPLEASFCGLCHFLCWQWEDYFKSLGKEQRFSGFGPLPTFWPVMVGLRDVMVLVVCYLACANVLQWVRLKVCGGGEPAILGLVGFSQFMPYFQGLCYSFKGCALPASLLLHWGNCLYFHIMSSLMRNLGVEVGISLVLLSGMIVIFEQLICFHLMLEFSLVSVNPIYPSKEILCFYLPYFIYH